MFSLLRQHLFSLKRKNNPENWKTDKETEGKGITVCVEETEVKEMAWGIKHLLQKLKAPNANFQHPPKTRLLW